MQQFAMFMRRMFPHLPLHQNANEANDQPALGQRLDGLLVRPAVPPVVQNNVLPNGNVNKNSNIINLQYFFIILVIII